MCALWSGGVGAARAGAKLVAGVAGFGGCGAAAGSGSGDLAGYGGGAGASGWPGVSWGVGGGGVIYLCTSSVSGAATPVCPEEQVAPNLAMQPFASRRTNGSGGLASVATC